MLPDVLLDNPFLNDAFDFSRYPTFRTRHARSRGHRGAPFFPNPGRGSPTTAQRPRNVSEPQLISSTNYMRESWFTNITSTCTVDALASLSSPDSSDDNLLKLHPSQSTTVDYEPPGDCTWRADADDDQTQKSSPTLRADAQTCDASCVAPAEPSVSTSEEDSFYSMDSADQDAHPALLSMPIIPQIKLQRKATVKHPEPPSPLDDVQNQSFLSPRIRDFRTSAGVSSRRYGRIVARCSPLTDASDAVIHPYGPDACGLSGNEWVHARSASEPMPSSVCPSDGEEELLSKKGVEESPHSDVLLSLIDEVGSSPGQCVDAPGSDVCEPSKSQPPLERPTRSHRRSPMSFSVSFGSIVRAVADRYVPLDHRRRKPKTKPQPTLKPTPDHLVPNLHDPMSKWAPDQGHIVVKVFVPSTDDIWKFRVPQDITLADFRSRVRRKLGFSVSFSASLWDEPTYYFKTDARFESWVKRRIRFGRNVPLVAHVPPVAAVREAERRRGDAAR